ncbi:MAG: ATP-binding protein [Eubacteriaceae bacterium]|nr:ATP-binding protein [Eubacteriaceae bacterium]
MEMIPRRVSAAILNSLASGVVPRIGLGYIAVGRAQEISAIMGDLNTIEDGGAMFRFIIGRYGAGKSFLLQMVRNYAMDKGFVVCDCDLSPHRRLCGTKSEGLATYRELISRMSTKLRPDGGAIEAIIQKWVNGIRSELAPLYGGLGGHGLAAAVEERIISSLASIQEFAHGFDFAASVAAYYKAYEAGDEDGIASALKWLKGDFSTKREARSQLPVGEAVNDENWYETLKLMAAFLKTAGYSGLVCFLDEGVNLYKIPNRISREKNYEKLLTIFNDAMQGKAKHIGFYMAGTLQFVEDERKGLFSYEALKSRLSENRFSEYASENALIGPTIKLPRLSDSEIFLLLEKIRDIHASHYEYETQVSGDDISLFIQACLSSAGATDFITPRELAKDFIGALGALSNASAMNMKTLLEATGFKPSQPAGNEEEDEFTPFEL